MADDQNRLDQPLATAQSSTYDAINDDDSKLAESAEGRKPHVVDTLHKIFFYISVPGTIACGVLAAVLFALKDIEAWTASLGVAGMCTFSATLITFFLIFCHLTVYTNPEQQRLIVRILLMVPIYAIDSFLALVLYKYAPIVNLIRDTYEAYVIYMFFKLLMSYLDSEENVLQRWAAEKPTMKHLFPFCWLPHLKLDAGTLSVWKICLVQYMILNPILTLIALPLSFLPPDEPAYRDGDFSPENFYPYASGIRFISVSFAFTSLVYFFFGTKQFMMEHKPMAKFAAIKMIVFLSFWQTVLLAGLAHFNVIKARHVWTKDQVATGMGNFVICIEMYFISVAHRWIFSDTPYMPSDGHRQPCPTRFAFKHAFSVTDVLDDTKNAAQLAARMIPSPTSKTSSPTSPTEANGDNNVESSASMVEKKPLEETAPVERSPREAHEVDVPSEN